MAVVRLRSDLKRRRRARGLGQVRPVGGQVRLRLLPPVAGLPVGLHSSGGHLCGGRVGGRELFGELSVALEQILRNTLFINQLAIETHRFC